MQFRFFPFDNIFPECNQVFLQYLAEFHLADAGQSCRRGHDHLHSREMGDRAANGAALYRQRLDTALFCLESG